MQVALEGFGGGQTLEDALFLVGVVGRTRAHALEALLQPALLVVVRHVHVLDTDRAAVGLLQGLEDVAEFGLGRQALERTDAEGLVEVGIGEPVEGRLELVDLGTRHALQRIEIGPAGAERTIGGDQLADSRLLLVLSRSRGGCGLAETAVLGQFGKSGNDRCVGDVARDEAGHLGQTIEIVTPLGRHRGRVVKIILVQLLDERRVAAEVHGAVELLIHRSHRHPL